jgi:hypothetical protein
LLAFIFCIVQVSLVISADREQFQITSPHRHGFQEQQALQEQPAQTTPRRTTPPTSPQEQHPVQEFRSIITEILDLIDPSHANRTARQSLIPANNEDAIAHAAYIVASNNENTGIIPHETDENSSKK